MAGRYYPQKDIDTFDKFNKELVSHLKGECEYCDHDPETYEREAPVIVFFSHRI